jgi:uncharacterized membrane protein
MENSASGLKAYSICAVGQLIIGVMGIILGIWVEFFRPSSPGELMINRSLLFYSIGFIVAAVMQFSLIRKVKSKTK